MAFKLPNLFKRAAENPNGKEENIYAVAGQAAGWQTTATAERGLAGVSGNRGCFSLF
jgi:hypothetical protein